MRYSKNAEALTPSAIRDMMVRAATYDDIVSFAVGEPDFISAPNVLEAACKAAMAGETKYAPGAGVTELRRIYAQYLSETIGVPYTWEEIQVTTGGCGALFLAMSSILDPGDEVIISTPYWTNYNQQIRQLYAVPVMVDVYEENNFVMTAEDIEKAVTDKTKLIMINSPANPTGGVIEKESLEQIARIVREHDLFVISDEVYRHILFDGAEYTSIASLPGMKERTMIIDSVSKTHAMTGFRVGFGAGPVHWVKLMTKLTENVVSSVCTISQYAAMEAITNGNDYREMMCREYEKRMNYIYDRINAMELLSCIRPKGAFYLFVNIKKTGMTSVDFCNKLLDQKHVAAVPGSNFGPCGEGFVRISYATSLELIQEGLDRIEAFLKENC
jgi:aminotransferase